MASVIGFMRRNWAIFAPPELPKSSDAVRLGLLGASEVATMSIFPTAKSHPDLIVAAVAARDKSRAEAYAKKHKIPIVHDSYQDLLDDPSIDAIYIPLPNGLHYEWALRALKAGKHILVEKPFTSNATEARRLVDFHASLSSPSPSPTNPSPNPKPLIMLDASHNLFHPAFTTFLSLLSPAHITLAIANQAIPAGFFSKDNIRFQYDLAGGTLMDFGAYNVACLRQIFGSEPVECVSAEATRGDPKKGWDEKCDVEFRGEWKWPNGGVGRMYAALAAPSHRGWPRLVVPNVVVKHREVEVPAGAGSASAETETETETGADGGESRTQQHLVTRTVTMTNYMAPHVWHRIDVLETHVLKSLPSGRILKTWTEKERKKVYSWNDISGADKNKGKANDENWSTYRYMLEEFVNRIKGRSTDRGSGVWLEPEWSVGQMRMVDQGYEVAGLGVRPTSGYLV